MMYLILGAVFALAVIVGSMVVAWAVKHTPVDREEDGSEAEAAVRSIREATAPMPLERSHVQAWKSFGGEQ